MEAEAVVKKKHPKKKPRKFKPYLSEVYHGIPIRPVAVLRTGLKNGPFVDTDLFRHIQNFQIVDKNHRTQKPRVPDVLRWLLDQGLDKVKETDIVLYRQGTVQRTITTAEFDPEPLKKVAELATKFQCSQWDVLAAALRLGYASLPESKTEEYKI